MSRADAWTDEQMLEALHMRDHLRMKYDDIGKNFGRTKSAMAGMFSRIDKETDEHFDTTGDGSMPPRWWRRTERPDA